MSQVGGQAALIFLHGSGDSGTGIREWLEEASGGAFHEQLRAANVTTVLPSAPRVFYTLAGGPLTVWFDRQGMAYEAPEDMSGMARSVEQVDAEIDALLAAGIPLRRIGVVGFSMGGCLALHVAYGAGRHAGKLGCSASLSSFLAQDSGLDAIARSRKAAVSQATGCFHGICGCLSGVCGSPAERRRVPTPLFMAHGAADSKVSPKWHQATRDRLEAAGVAAPAEVVLFPGLDHDMCSEELQQLVQFVIRHLTGSDS